MVLKNHSSSAVPIPFDLSRDNTVAKKARETKASVSKMPLINNVAPCIELSYSKMGRPTPVQNAAHNDIATPKYSPRIISIRRSGWASINSMNSYELYR